MGLFDKVREAFGDDKTDGNGNNTSKNSYEVIFVEEKLGMTLSGAPDGTPAVTGVATGGPAEKANVRVGDTVLFVNGEGPYSYIDVLTAVKTPRPTTLTFQRAGATGRDARGGGGEGNPFSRAQDAARRKMEEMQGKQPQPPPMTDAEKRARREAALKAAETRTKDWNKKINKGRQESRKKESANDEVPENQFESSQSAETRRVVQLAKQQEARTAASMGYNPYQARLMGNNAARAAISGIEGTGAGEVIPETVSSPTFPAPGVVRGRGHVLGGEGATKTIDTEEFEGEEGNLAVGISMEIEEALGLVLAQGPAISLLAVQTMLKMMKNMAKNNGQDKFKRVRIANANFNSKVGSVDGGIQVMEAAGYELKTDEGEVYLQHGSCDPVPLRLRVAMQKLEQAEVMLT